MPFSPYLIEIPPKKNLPSHFFIHKGEKVGYVLSGKLQMRLEKSVHNLNPSFMVGESQKRGFDL
jgi:hypothetical protein